MKKIILISAAVIATAAFAADVVRPMQVTLPNGVESGLRIIGTNQSVPFIQIVGTNQLFSVNADGSVTTGSVTNQITFGGTNSAPVNTTNVSAWVSVSVSGNTNVYRLPLYK